MGREPLWSGAEDELLLRTAGQAAARVNQQLVAAGFQERTAQQIKQRRNYLRKKSAFHAVWGETSDPSDTEQALLSAMQRRRQITQQMEQLEAELKELNQVLHNLLPGFQESIEQV